MSTSRSFISYLWIAGIIFFHSQFALHATSIQVGENVLVSGGKADLTHYEVLIAASAKDPNNLVGGAMVFSEAINDYFLAAYSSTDKGKTWSPALEIKDFDTDACDPTIAFGPDGSAYFAVIGYFRESEFDTYVYRSADGGKHWDPPTKLDLGIDREYLTVDNTGGKYNGRIYLHGAAGVSTIDKKPDYATDITIVRSIDQGKTFSSPVKLVSSGSNYVVPMGNGAILSDGTFVIAFGEVPKYWRENGSGIPPATPKNPNAKLKIVSSEDGGVTFLKAINVTDWYLDHASWNTSVIPTLSVDQSTGPFRDRLYLVWNDERKNRSLINFSYSKDKGKTWSEAIIINDEPHSSNVKTDHFMPVAAVNSDGVLGIMWYDRRESLNNQDWIVRFTASLDGGESFLPSVKVSTAAFTHRKEEAWTISGESTGGGSINDWTRGGPIQVNLGMHSFYFNGGHTAGMASADKSFHPFWIDNRTGLPQIWTAAVNVNGVGLQNGVEELSAFQDITENVGLVITETNYDPKTKTVSANAHLVNTSDKTITGPIKTRLFSIQSAVGVAQILNDEGKNTENVILNFTPLLENNELKPKAQTKPMRLRFRLSDLQPIQAGTDWMVRLVSLKARVYGNLEKKP